MVLINGRKFACEACIRGHRASGCAHTGRQMLPVRRKGRPTSQCDQCKAKRATGSFHGRCDCSATPGETSSRSGSRVGKEETSPSGSSSSSSMGDTSGGEASATEDNSAALQPRHKKRQRRVLRGAMDPNVEIFFAGGNAVGSNGMRAPKGKHSLASLMNPCQCRTTGICTCCKSSSAADPRASDTGRPSEPPRSDALVMSANCKCDGGDNCCNDEPDKSLCGKKAQSDTAGSSCCTRSQRRSPPLPPTAADMHTSQDLKRPAGCTAGDAESSLDIDCNCGPSCSCPGCLHSTDNHSLPEEGPTTGARSSETGSTSGSSPEDPCPVKCVTCSACVYGLMRPSGIEAVDEWMERDKHPSHLDALPLRPQRSEALTPGSHIPSHVPTPPDPPLSGARDFVRTHFEDEARREWFAAQARTQEGAAKLYGEGNLTSYYSTADGFPHVQAQSQNDSMMRANSSSADSYGAQLPAESVEQWQARHGFFHLTPDAVAIFDRARQFREQRARDEAAAESEIPEVTAAASAPINGHNKNDLDLLRKRALAARGLGTGPSRLHGQAKA